MPCQLRKGMRGRMKSNLFSRFKQCLLFLRFVLQRRWRLEHGTSPIHWLSWSLEDVWALRESLIEIVESTSCVNDHDRSEMSVTNYNDAFTCTISRQRKWKAVCSKYCRERKRAWKDEMNLMEMLGVLQSDTSSKFPTFVKYARRARIPPRSQQLSRKRSATDYARATVLSRESWIAVFRIVNFASSNPLNLTIQLL